MAPFHVFLFLVGIVVGGATVYVWAPQIKFVEVEVPAKTSTELSSEKDERCPAHLLVRAPLLPPPKFRFDSDEKLITNNYGEVKLTWTSVDQAQKYHLQVYDSRGKLFKTLKTSRTILYLKDLPFNKDIEVTPYSIALQTENSDGELGEVGEKRPLAVRRLLSLYAPRIRSISVED